MRTIAVATVRHFCPRRGTSNLLLTCRGCVCIKTAVARGDLTQKVTGVSVSGEMLELVKTINDMIDQLAIFASEVKKVAREVGTEGKLGVQAEVGNVQGVWQEITCVVVVVVGIFSVSAFSTLTGVLWVGPPRGLLGCR